MSKDASCFLQMCREFGVHPAVKQLHEWSTWVTPESQPRRFDTKFFLTVLDHQPHASHDNKEATTTDWLSPADVVHNSETIEIKVNPPQYYTMNELLPFTTLQELEEAAKNKASSWNFHTFLSHLFSISSSTLLLR